MKVYALWYGNYDNYDVLGIYADKQCAEAAIADIPTCITDMAESDRDDMSPELAELRFHGYIGDHLVGWGADRTAVEAQLAAFDRSTVFSVLEYKVIT